MSREMNSTPEYEVLRELGRGAIGSVQLVQLQAPFAGLPSGALMAVKRLRGPSADGDWARESLEAEARTGREVQHPSLVRILGHTLVGDNGPALFMEYVSGEDLRDWVSQRGPMPEPLLRRIAHELASALAALHGAGVVHGDVKPENVRLEEHGRAVLIDLGMSAAIERGATHRVDGSPAYLAPERLGGAGPTPEADVWALGVLLYELATARHPFLGGSQKRQRDEGAAARIATLRRAEFVPPSTAVPSLTPFCDRLLALTLAPAAGDRPTAEALASRWQAGEAGPFWRAELARAPSALPATKRRHLTPSVGREAEHTELLNIQARASGSSPRGALVWLVGPSGAGKTRLVRDFAERVRTREHPPIFLETRCAETREAGGTGALLDLVRHLLSLPLDGVAGERETSYLATFTPPEHLQTLRAALGGDAPPSGSLTRALVACLVGLTRVRPLLLFIDDMHMAGAATLAGVELLVSRMPSLPAVLVLALREEHIEHLDTLRQQAQLADAPHELANERIELAPLTKADMLAMVEARFASTAPRLRLANVLWKRSRGLPGLVAEILRDLRAAGDLDTPLDEPWTLRRSPEEIPLPGSLGATIRRRFERLPPRERLWLRRLSVVGGHIRPEFLEQAFPEAGRVALDTVLSALVAERWIAPIGGRYRFARPALREAVYNSIPESRRRELHGRAADALGRGAQATRQSQDENFQHIFHLRAAGRHREVVDLLLPLLERLAASHQPARVHSLARWGLEALDTLPVGMGSDQMRLHFLEYAADAADRLGRRGEERKHLDELANRFDDPDQRPGLAARIYLLHGRYAANVGQFGLARGFLHNAAQFSNTAGDRRIESAARRQLALVHSQVGELDEAREEARIAFELGRTERELAAAEVTTALLDLLEDRIEEALRATDETLARLRPLPAHVAPDLLAAAHLVRARVWSTLGRAKRGIGSANHALRLAERAGQRRLAVETRARIGGLWVAVGQPDTAHDVLRAALDEAHAIEDRRGEALASLWLGTLLLEQDDPNARPMLQRSVSLAHEIGYGRGEAVAQAIFARLEFGDGHLPAALERSERAEYLLDKLGAELGDRIVIAGTRAMVLRATRSTRAAATIQRRLRSRIATQVRHFSDRELGRASRVGLRRLLNAVLSSEDVIYPRAGP